MEKLRGALERVYVRIKDGELKVQADTTIGESNSSLPKPPTKSDNSGSLMAGLMNVNSGSSPRFSVPTASPNSGGFFQKLAQRIAKEQVQKGPKTVDVDTELSESDVEISNDELNRLTKEIKKMLEEEFKR